MRLECVSGVNKYSLWPTLWKFWERTLAEHGCLQIHKYMIEHPGDWTIWYLHVSDSSMVRFDATQPVIMQLRNGTEVRSCDILATESKMMCEAYSVTTGSLTFKDGTRYSRSGNGAFVVWIAFDEGTLGLVHDDRDLDRADFEPPVKVIIERGVAECGDSDGAF